MCTISLSSVRENGWRLSALSSRFSIDERTLSTAKMLSVLQGQVPRGLTFQVKRTNLLGIPIPQSLGGVPPAADANTHTFSPCHAAVCLRFPDRKCSGAAKKFERSQPKRLTTLSACGTLSLIKKLRITSQFHLQPPASVLECRRRSWEVFCWETKRIGVIQ